jgi:hypothetical protein
MHQSKPRKETQPVGKRTPDVAYCILHHTLTTLLWFFPRETYHFSCSPPLTTAKDFTTSFPSASSPTPLFPLFGFLPWKQGCESGWFYLFLTFLDRRSAHPFIRHSAHPVIVHTVVHRCGGSGIVYYGFPNASPPVESYGHEFG